MSKWQPIETYKRSDGVVIFYYPPQDHVFFDHCYNFYRKEQLGERMVIDIYPRGEPTHWMPLPEVPKENEMEGK